MRVRRCSGLADAVVSAKRLPTVRTQADGWVDGQTDRQLHEDELEMLPGGFKGVSGREGEP